MTLENRAEEQKASPVFPGRATAPGLGFDLFKASCLLLDGESWLPLVSAGERQGGRCGGGGIGEPSSFPFQG